MKNLIITSCLLWMSSIGAAEELSVNERSESVIDGVSLEATPGLVLGRPNLGVYTHFDQKNSLGVYGYFAAGFSKNVELKYRRFSVSSVADSYYWELGAGRETINTEAFDQLKKIPGLEQWVNNLEKEHNYTRMMIGHQWHMDSGFQVRFALGARYNNIGSPKRNISSDMSLSFGTVL